MRTVVRALRLPARAGASRALARTVVAHRTAAAVSHATVWMSRRHLSAAAHAAASATKATAPAAAAAAATTAATPKGGKWAFGYDVSSLARDGAAVTRDYQRDGFVVVHGLVPPAELATLKAEIAAVARGKYGRIPGLPEHALATANAGAGGGSGAAAGAGGAAAALSDDEVIRQYLCFHHPHKMSPVLRAMLAHPNIARALTYVVGPNVKCMQSMFFVKAAGKPGQAWHQDEFYIPTRDRSLVGAWLAVDDATIDNGCLWMHPGSHRPGVLWRQRPHNDPRFDPAGETYDSGYQREGGVSVEIPAGSVAFFNGYVLHRSLPNVSNRFRRAYVCHYMSAESLLPWDCDGTVPATADNRDVIMVAGTDPYAHKGYVSNLTFPFLRADKAATNTDGAGEIRGAAAYKT